MTSGSRSAPPPSRWLAGRLLAVCGVLACSALLVGAGSWLQSRATVKFEARTTSDLSLQIFHSGAGAFTEPASDTVAIGRHGAKIRLRVPSGEATELRVDPAPNSAPFELCNLRVRDGTKSAYSVLRAQDVVVSDVGDCLSITSKADAPDPFVVVRARHPVAQAASSAWTLLTVAAFVVALGALAVLIGRLDSREGPLAGRATHTFNFMSRHCHRLAFVLLLVFGGMFAHVLPPNGVPDEVTHLSKIAKIHGGAWLNDSGATPIVGVAEMYGPLWDDAQKPEPLDLGRLDAQLDRKLECTEAVRALPTSADNYSPHLYAAPALVLAASCGVHTSFGSFLSAARLANLLIAALLIAVGIRYATYGKWALFGVALLPMTLSQLASISADSMILSLSFCFIGLVSGIAGGALSAQRVRVALPLIALMLAFSKPGSAWVLVAVLFCYRACADGPVRFRELLLTSLVGPWIIHFLWTLWSAGGAHYGPGVDAAANRALLLGDPLSVVGMGFNTFFGDGAPGMYQSLVGRLGWLDVPLSPWAYTAAGGMLMAALWTNPDTTRIGIPVRIVAAFASLGSLALLSLPLFLVWTQTGASVIQGLQGRYFLPTLAFLLVFGAMRSGPVLRLVLLACVLCMPVLSFDAENHVQSRYYGGPR